MQKISFEDTTVVKSPYVIIDGVEHEVYNGTYQGGTDLNAQTFNQMQDNIESAIEDVEDAMPTIENSLDSDSTVNGASVHAVNDKINNLSTYSTTETVCGTWLNKPLYRKVLDVGALPDSTTKLINHNIENLNYFTSISGIAIKGSGNNLPIPFIHEGTLSNSIRIYAYETQVVIACGSDRTTWNGYVILEYTKTTD